MSILITGGTGKTGSRLAGLLGERARVATRTPSNSDEVRFEWDDDSSYEAALDNVEAVYLIAPANHPEPLTAMTPFLDLALARGVKRFVLLSASSLAEGGPMMGKVHSYLKANAPEWAALRPTWFMQNFSEQQHLSTIRKEHAIYSAARDGRVPFIDADDIAAVAAALFTAPELPCRDLILTGPHAISYDRAAEILTDVTGYPVAHRRLQESDLVDRYATFGIERSYATALAAMDTEIAAGSEDRVTDEVLQVTGRAPKDFVTFCHEQREAWLTSVAH